jgi:hypothetical protein
MLQCYKRVYSQHFVDFLLFIVFAWTLGFVSKSYLHFKILRVSPLFVLANFILFLIFCYCFSYP